LYDKAMNMLSYPFELDRGRRLHRAPIELGDGLASRVLTTRQPLRLASLADQREHATVTGGTYEEDLGDASLTESWLGAPILVGNDAIGILVVGDYRPNAYTEADERLVTTVASSMGVALENARLFNETKRQKAEADERAAELAIINSVQEGLAENLDMQSMYDLVGDKIQETFDAQTVDIAMIDKAAEEIRFTYNIERGRRLHVGPFPLMGVRRHVMETREPVVLNRDLERRRVEEFGQPAELYGLPSLSAVFVPLASGGEVTGVISLQNG